MSRRESALTSRYAERTYVRCYGQGLEPACFRADFGTFFGMAQPIQPVTLTVEQIKELNEKLGGLRHDVNNHLSTLMTAIELVRSRPEMTDRLLTKMNEQPRKISGAIREFSDEFEKAMGIVAQEKCTKE